jgi:predicted AAA+ superfamily ATPase
MLPRHLQARILQTLAHFPVVAVLGGRQVGKTTLVRALARRAWPARYVTLDERPALDRALADPDGFADGLQPPVILDEVQRAPDLLRAIKRVVDGARRPGMFLLTGSANLLTLRSVSESLAGRAIHLELLPLSLAELHRSRAPGDTLEALFTARSAREFLRRLPASAPDAERATLSRRIMAGGYPVPALMPAGRPRTDWFESYRSTYLERDLREVSQIAHLTDFARLLATAALRTGQLLNVADLWRDLDVPAATLRRHLGILETTYQIRLVHPYHANVGKRLVKTPKLYFNDTGLAAHLAGADDWADIEQRGRAGAMVETWVASELRKLTALGTRRTEILFWRPHGGREVDFLLERGSQRVAIEVKWTQRLGDAELAGLRSCRAALGNRLGLAALLYAGGEVFVADEKIAAVPLHLFFAGRRP